MLSIFMIVLSVHLNRKMICTHIDQVVVQIITLQETKYSADFLYAPNNNKLTLMTFKILIILIMSIFLLSIGLQLICSTASFSENFFFILSSAVFFVIQCLTNFKVPHHSNLSQYIDLQFYLTIHNVNH